MSCITGRRAGRGWPEHLSQKWSFMMHESQSVSIIPPEVSKSALSPQRGTFGALAEFERDIIRERTNAGLEAARSRGKLGGRPPALSPEKIKFANTLYADKTTSVTDICRMLGISWHTLQRYVKGDRK